MTKPPLRIGNYRYSIPPKDYESRLPETPSEMPFITRFLSVFTIVTFIVATIIIALQ